MNEKNHLRTFGQWIKQCVEEHCNLKHILKTNKKVHLAFISSYRNPNKMNGRNHKEGININKNKNINKVEKIVESIY